MRRRRFVTADVFTDRPFGGNPVAVVLNADSLSTAAMQAVASEFNLSEITFLLPPRDPANAACACERSTSIPHKLLTRRYGPRAGVPGLLARFRCRTCGKPPVSAEWIDNQRAGRAAPATRRRCACRSPSLGSGDRPRSTEGRRQQAGSPVVSQLEI